MRADPLQRRHRKKVAVVATTVLCAGTLAVAALSGAPARAAQRAKRSLLSANETSGQWVNIGPAPMVRSLTPGRSSGRVASIAVDPSNPSHWLLGVGNGGVWETRDSGQSWVPAAD